MTAVARLFVFTLTLVTLGSSSACLTTICLNALCASQSQARTLRGSSASLPIAGTVERSVKRSLGAATESDRSGHNCDSMRF